MIQLNGTLCMWNVLRCSTHLDLDLRRGLVVSYMARSRGRPGNHCIRGWVGPRASWTFRKRGQTLAPARNRTIIIRMFSPYPSRDTNYTTPAHKTWTEMKYTHEKELNILNIITRNEDCQTITTYK